MTKVGRNDRCPCGSGLKYKKCCLETDRSAQKVGGGEREPFLGLHAAYPNTHGALPYVLTKLFASSDEFEAMKWTDPEKARTYWIPARLASMETEEIVARLTDLGVDGSKDEYLSRIGDRTSAWDVSSEWLQDVRHRLSDREQDFLGLASCELWKRYRPEYPSVEMLDDWMQEGYDFALDGHAEKACDRWWQVWETIRARLTPDITTIAGADAVFEGTQTVEDWIHDFDEALLNAPSAANMGIRFLEDVLDRFPGEPETVRIGCLTDLGQLYCRAGRFEEGERLLADIIETHPDAAIGYARLSDVLLDKATRDGSHVDRERARKVLEAALARPVADAEDYDLEVRLRAITDTD